MAGAVRSAPFDSIFPSFGSPIHNGGRLMIIDGQRQLLGGKHKSKIKTVRNINHIPIVKIRNFHRVPLDIIARRPVLGAYMVGIDRCLVPINVQDYVVKLRSGCRRHCLLYTTGGHAPLAFDCMDSRRLRTEKIQRGVSKTKRSRYTNSTCTRCHFHKWTRASRVSIQSLYMKFAKQRRFVCRVPSKPK